MPVITPQKSLKVKRTEPRVSDKLADALKINPITAQLLVNRGITTIEEARAFLGADLSRLHDPFLLKGMEAAVARIQKAKKQKERVLIFGDYDVDGVTSMTLLHKVLTDMGIPVVHHIPHRIQDGYGLNENIAALAQEQGIGLLIAVDCGITSCHEVNLLNQRGIDVVIVDHHEPSAEGLPKAVAIVDPKQPGCLYPFKHLAAVGLVAKLVCALTGRVPEEDLDMVALGTIADVVPLLGENRIFVKAGLPKIAETKKKGLAALMEVAKIKGKKMQPHYVGFILGPRINATGRMDSAQKSLDLLLSDDPFEALALAKELDGFNSERQRLQRSVLDEAVQMVEAEVNFKEHQVIVISKEGWHRGVLGIVASRVAEMYGRPTIIISLEEGIGTASARSVEGFHLHAALEHCANLLETFGGHKLAAGLTIKKENIEMFREWMNGFAKDIFRVCDFAPALEVDCEVPLCLLDEGLVKEMELLEPFGEGNPSPVFYSRQVTVKGKPSFLGKETIKFWVTDGIATVSAVGFGMAKYRDIVVPGGQVDIVYQLTLDDWMKAPTLQLKLKDIKGSQP